MYKLFFFAYLIFSALGGAQAADQKEGLSLVIGSTRYSDSLGGPIFRSVIDGEHSNTTHLKTFGRKAVTVDIEPCDIEGAQHLTVDAMTYSFSPIKEVYIERFFTYNRENPSDGLGGAGGN